ncbi:ornithine carbamoyltransferase [Fodinisporobacter ferrooxydans]|uniref:Ornithine carbamoyltransferase n=1 Tax=Fodinisporobacter ferrooxydans TaxID=2901836 RepID=A0ABY4CU05_9BACL|nr:ornithine carbamoyltransferase [Alicyclobacillaceae bacterium MYW30-H2]
MAMPQQYVQEATLAGKDFIDFADFTPEEVYHLLDLAASIKYKQKQGDVYQPLKGKTLGMIFEKASTRTRVSFEVGMFQLGGHALFLSGHDTQIGRGEPLPDTAQVLSRYVDGIMIRTFSHQNVIDLAKYATVPVINALTDLHHPCQVLADILTLKEHHGSIRGKKVAYVGDGNNMAHSWLVAAPLFGMDISVASPKGYLVNEEVLHQALVLAEKYGTKVLVTEDPAEAVAGAHVVYTDVWASMGQEAEQAERLQAFAGYQVNEELCKHAAADYLFMHCLPAHRGEEVSAGIIDGPHSVIFDEAENRLHVQKAILVATMA